MNKKLTSFLLLYASLVPMLYAWEDHPDCPDHSETDRIYKLAQIQTGAEQYEKELSEKGETNEKDDDPKLCFLEMRIRMGRSP